MRRNFFLLWLITCSVAGQVEKVSLPELERRLMLNKDSVLVVNFWATWCSPCIEELPLFDSLYQNAENYKSEKRNVSVMLVSLDFASQLESKVKPFVIKQRLKAPVILLDESDANVYINRMHRDWSGAIPATLLIRPSTGERKLIERKFESYDDLKQSIFHFIERQ